MFVYSRRIVVRRLLSYTILEGHDVIVYVVGESYGNTLSLYGDVNKRK